jgi:hypothetical protein
MQTSLQTLTYLITPISILYLEMLLVKQIILLRDHYADADFNINNIDSNRIGT